MIGPQKPDKHEDLTKDMASGNPLVSGRFNQNAEALKLLLEGVDPWPEPMHMIDWAAGSQPNISLRSDASDARDFFPKFVSPSWPLWKLPHGSYPSELRVRGREILEETLMFMSATHHSFY